MKSNTQLGGKALFRYVKKGMRPEVQEPMIIKQAQSRQQSLSALEGVIQSLKEQVPTPSVRFRKAR